MFATRKLASIMHSWREARPSAVCCGQVMRKLVHIRRNRDWASPSHILSIYCVTCFRIERIDMLSKRSTQVGWPAGSRASSHDFAASCGRISLNTLDVWLPPSSCSAKRTAHAGPLRTPPAPRRVSASTEECASTEEWHRRVAPKSDSWAEEWALKHSVGYSAQNRPLAYRQALLPPHGMPTTLTLGHAHTLQTFRLLDGLPLRPHSGPFSTTVAGAATQGARARRPAPHTPAGRPPPPLPSGQAYFTLHPIHPTPSGEGARGGGVGEGDGGAGGSEGDGGRTRGGIHRWRWRWRWQWRYWRRRRGLWR